MSSYNRMINELSELVQSEHCEGCGDDTCDIRACYDSGYALWAIYLLDSSGAYCDRFDHLIDKLRAQHGGRFERAAERERAEFVARTSSITCAECNAVTWLTEYVDAEYYAAPDARCAACMGFIYGDSAQGDQDEKVS